MPPQGCIFSSPSPQGMLSGGRLGDGYMSHKSNLCCCSVGERASLLAGVHRLSGDKLPLTFAATRRRQKAGPSVRRSNAGEHHEKFT